MIDPGSINKILIRGTNWIGDAVLTTPALTAIGRHFNKAQICLLAKPHVVELLKFHPSVHQSIVYDPQRKHKGIGGKRRLIDEIGSKNFDLYILFQNGLEAALLGFFSGIPIRYGYRTKGRGVFLTHGVPVPLQAPGKHQVYYYLDLLENIGIRGGDPELSVRTTEVEDRLAGETLGSYGISDGDLVVGLNPGATYGPAKRWPWERFADLGNRLTSEQGAKIVLFGNAQERALAEKISNRLIGKPILLAGETTLRELMALLKRCHVLVTNDTGPMHIGTALGIPVVSLFGPTDPSATGPYGKGAVVLRRKVECSPCRLRICPIDHRCMERLTVGDAYGAVLQNLNREGKKRLTTEIHEHRGRDVNPPSFREAAVFLDRDGTLNKDVGYPDRIERLELYPRTASAIRILNDHGIKAVVITNQSGIARGIMSEEQVKDLHSHLEKKLRQKGATLDGIYYCPHHPEAGHSPLTRPCLCRKPNTGLAERASKAHGIDPKKSYVVGDKWSDLVMAQRIGAKGILVLTGEGAEQISRHEDLRDKAEAIVPDLFDAVKWILNDLSIRDRKPAEEMVPEIL